MDKYLEAAAAVDYLKPLRAKQHLILVKHKAGFMKAPPVFDATPSQLKESIYKIGQGQIDDRLQYFAKVRGLFISSVQSLLKEEV